MKALKVYESIFVPKSDEEIRSNLPQDFAGLIRLGLKEFDRPQSLPIDYFPLIIQLAIIIKEDNRFEIKIRPSFSDFGATQFCDFGFAFDNGKVARREIIRQYYNNDFAIPVTDHGGPLYMYKFYSFDDLLKYLDPVRYDKENWQKYRDEKDKQMGWDKYKI